MNIVKKIHKGGSNCSPEKKGHEGYKKNRELHINMDTELDIITWKARKHTHETRKQICE